MRERIRTMAYHRRGRRGSATKGIRSLATRHAAARAAEIDADGPAARATTRSGSPISARLIAELVLTRPFNEMELAEQESLMLSLHMIANDLEKGMTQPDVLRFVLEVPNG